MNKDDKPDSGHSRFSQYDYGQMQILRDQVLGAYGISVLEENFDYQCVPENRRDWVNEFRKEYFHRFAEKIEALRKKGD